MSEDFFPEIVEQDPEPERTPREIATDKLLSRQIAYSHVFNPDNLAAKEVLEDLALFCRANETAFDPDPRIHAALEGRREVWLRIQRHTKLDSTDFLKLYLRKE